MYVGNQTYNITEEESGMDVSHYLSDLNSFYASLISLLHMFTGYRKCEVLYS